MFILCPIHKNSEHTYQRKLLIKINIFLLYLAIVFTWFAFIKYFSIFSHLFVKRIPIQNYNYLYFGNIKVEGSKTNYLDKKWSEKIIHYEKETLKESLIIRKIVKIEGVQLGYVG